MNALSGLRFLALALVGLVILPWDPSVVPGPMPRDMTPTPADERQETASFIREVVMFPCSGVRCQAWLYLPTSSSNGALPPVVVAAHGLGAQKDFGLNEYGERFAAAGLASFIFDYRTFGGSEGEPRHWASPSRHLADWADAVAYVRGPELSSIVDAQRLLLWGTSFGGGHAIMTAAALGEAVKGVVAQVPFTDGRAAFARGYQSRGPWVMARAVVAALHDGVRGLARYPPAYYRLVGRPGGSNFMGLDDVQTAGYFAKHPARKQGGWRNVARCLLTLEVSRYRPVEAVPHVTAPMLFVAAGDDQLCPPEDTRAAASVAKNATLVVEPGLGHFDVYASAHFERLASMQAAFFREAVGLPPTPVPVDVLTDEATVMD